MGKRRGHSSFLVTRKKRKTLKENQELISFIKTNTKPKLINFIFAYPHLAQVNYFEFTQLRGHIQSWESAFTAIMTKQKPNLKKEFNALKKTTVSSWLPKNVIQLNMKNILFQWYYLQITSPRLVPIFSKMFEAAINIPLLNDNQQILKTHCVKLFKNYKSLSNIEHCILKLCISNIVNVANEEMVPYFKSLFPESVWNRMIAPIVVDHVPNDVKKIIMDVCDYTFQLSCTSGWEHAASYLIKRRSRLFLSRNSAGSKHEYQIVSILEYVFSMTSTWEKQDNNNTKKDDDNEEENDDNDDNEEDKEDNDDDEEDNDDDEEEKEDDEFIPENKDVVSEALCLIRVFNLLERLIDDDCELKVIPGEISAACTKKAKQYNELLFGGGLNSLFIESTASSVTSSYNTTSASDSSNASSSGHDGLSSVSNATSNNSFTGLTSAIINITTASQNDLPNSPGPSLKNIYGRKIDLLATGVEGAELSLCEFKKGYCSRIMNKQQTKSLRLNQCVLANTRREYSVDTEILSFDWGGMHGEMHTLKNDFGVCVVRPFAKLMLPNNISSLSNETKLRELQETIIAFYEWKYQMITLNNNIKNGKARTGLTTTSDDISSSDGNDSLKPPSPYACLSPRR